MTQSIIRERIEAIDAGLRNTQHDKQADTVISISALPSRSLQRANPVLPEFIVFERFKSEFVSNIAEEQAEPVNVVIQLLGLDSFFNRYE